MLEVQRRIAALRESPGNGRPLYERVANEMAQAIRTGELRPGERLPSVRQLATDLGLSVSTVMSVYTRLAEGGLVNGEAGRGTFVSETPSAAPAAQAPRPAAEPAAARAGSAWRRQVLAQTEARLKQGFPSARDLMRGGPDPALLPLSVIKRAFRDVSSRLTARDLEYPATLGTEPELSGALLKRLAGDGIEAEADDILIGGSTQQFLALLAMLLGRRAPGERVLVGVEEPGYQTAMDTLEFHGLGLVPMRLDESGVTAEGLRGALDAGVSAVLFTPRAQSPTGCGWSAERRQALADALVPHPDVWIIEDDQFAEAATVRPGSLYGDARLRERVVHLRSFSKSVAPDLRLSAAVVRQPIRHPLTMAKSFADGWTSRTSQRVLAAALTDPRIDDLLAEARTEYALRRAAVRDAVRRAGSARGLGLSVPALDTDGLHVWVTLPDGCDADRVVEAAAHRGFLLAAGQPFFLSPGDQRHLRINAGALAAEHADRLSTAVCDAVTSVLGQPTALLTP
ncbi:aminotransferase class I/II-fold pyridoxal phosphate-dependent enzyme [Actinomadura viridis]|uniref:GntR family transcriptional regulator/MocR family aminotransferase n=1 Tax=Actinomadura viridis TaxID=58110 RepID=A0A931DPN1_9ACTN|nr:PLP-dependent aminotransferase family protein [Actinomadura viridis]MBG6091481.1 GntR family transcriptional regulator/MocR family aminotransferase [Actinomadura viridis]